VGVETVFRVFLDTAEVRSLALIGMVMLPEALAFAAWPQHLNG